MHKKIVIKLISVIVVIIILITILISQNKNIITKVKDNICAISSFTITDNGTEIDVNINNTTNENIDLNKISLELYDSSNKKIKTINKNIDNKVKRNSQLSLKINNKEKYTSTSNVKCILYKIN